MKRHGLPWSPFWNKSCGRGLLIYACRDRERHCSFWSARKKMPQYLQWSIFWRKQRKNWKVLSLLPYPSHIRDFPESGKATRKPVSCLLWQVKPVPVHLPFIWKVPRNMLRIRRHRKSSRLEVRSAGMMKMHWRRLLYTSFTRFQHRRRHSARDFIRSCLMLRFSWKRLMECQRN